MNINTNYSVGNTSYDPVYTSNGGSTGQTSGLGNDSLLGGQSGSGSMTDMIQQLMQLIQAMFGTGSGTGSGQGQGQGQGQGGGGNGMPGGGGGGCSGHHGGFGGHHGFGGSDSKAYNGGGAGGYGNGSASGAGNIGASGAGGYGNAGTSGYGNAGTGETGGTGGAGGTNGGGGTAGGGNTETANGGNAQLGTVTGGTASQQQAALQGNQDDINAYGQYYTQKNADEVTNTRIDTPGGGAAGLTALSGEGNNTNIQVESNADGQNATETEAHEFNHAHSSDNWLSSSVGSNSDANEATTDWLAQQATGGYSNGVSSSYQGNDDKVQQAVDQGLISKDTLAKAYFSGDQDAIAQVQSAYQQVGLT